MKREVGTSAGILALLAVLLHLGAPGGRETTGNAQQNPAAEKKGGESQAAGDHRREGPWIATRAFFHAGEPPLPPPAGPPSPCAVDPDSSLACLIDLQHPPQPDGLRAFLGAPADFNRNQAWSIVATVADPAHTRLSLYFDRQVEAIERSMHAAQWDLAGQWLPWSDRVSPPGSNINEQRRQRHLQREQEQVPGILIFRRFGLVDGESRNDVLFLYLVPETPTNGVSGPTFYAALRLAHVLSPPAHVGFLAPSFSGSFAPLSTVVNQWNHAHGADDEDRISSGEVFYGGTISSQPAAQAFTRSTEIHAQFRSGIASSQDYNQVFCEVLARYAINSRDVAIMVEDETAFAHMADTAGAYCGAITQYVFPRDIAHLRDIYQQEAARPLNKAPTETGLSFSLKNSGSGEDSVPTFSDLQTPLSQYAVIQSITEDLRRRRTRIVRIVATNVLDALFLAHVVRREAPDTRVLADNPDVLFVAAATQSDLAGSVFLSTYPMFFEGDQWLATGSESTQRVMLPTPDSQGLYNATQFLLTRISAAHQPNLRGYSQTPQPMPYPGLWLLTLNRTGFAPVDLIDDHKDHATGWFEPNPQTGTETRKPKFPVPQRAWFTTAMTFSVFACGGCLLLFRVNVTPLLRWPVWLSVCDGRRLAFPRLVSLIACCLAASAIEWVLFLPVAVSNFERHWPWYCWSVPFGFLGWILPLAAAAWIWRKAARKPVEPQSALYLTLIIGVYAVVTVPYFYSCVMRPAPANFLFCYRAVELYSGSSPALPLMILGIVILAGSIFYVNRFARAGFARPCLRLIHFKSLRGPLVHCYDSINRQIAGPAGTGTEWQRRLFWSAAVLVACLIVFRPSLYASAFENPWYNRALSATVAAVLFCLVLACYDLFAIWNHLDRLLALIEVLPLRPAFQRITQDWPKRPIWVSNQTASKAFLARQMLVALHNRRVVVATREANADVLRFWAALPNRFDPRDLPLAKGLPAPPEKKSPPTMLRARTLCRFLLARRAYERMCASLLAKLVMNDLVPIWSRNLAEEGTPHGGEPGEEEKLARYSSDFVAMQFSRYLLYVVGHLQMIAWVISFGVVMLMAVLHSYTPQAPLLLSRFLAVLFLVIGVLVFRVFAGMERNGILSLLSGTKPGELNQEFWFRLIGMGILPFIGLLAHLFPSLSSFLYSWVTPTVESMH